MKAIAETMSQSVSSMMYSVTLFIIFDTRYCRISSLFMAICVSNV